MNIDQQQPEYHREWPQGKCPSEPWIDTYIQGDLSDDQIEAFKEHILGCVSCNEIVHMYEEIRKDQNQSKLLPVPEELVKQAKDLVREKYGMHILHIALSFSHEFFNNVKTTGDIIMGPGTQGTAPQFRGQEETQISTILIKKEFKDIHIQVELCRSMDRCNTLSVDITNTESNNPVDALRVTLIQDEDELESHVSEGGKINFDEIKPGKYTIEISNPEKVVGAISLELTDNET